MPTVAVKDMSGKAVGNMDLNPAIFDIEINEHAVHMAVVQYLANQRQGTKSAKTRAEVRGGGRKPWRQKGTGRARAGSTRAPHWRHGGVAFGPQSDKNYTLKMNRKEKRLALKSALSYKVIDKELVIIDELKLESNKTKEMKDILANLKVERNVMLLIDELDENAVLAARNLNNVLLLAADEINTMDVISANKIIATEAAIKSVEEALN